MPCSILTVPEFDKNIKKLAKRYTKIKSDLLLLTATLKQNPTKGTHLFGNCYKIRLANSSVPTGKSKGFRVITYYMVDDLKLYLLTIYSKSDKENISDSTIINILANIQ